MQQHIRSRVDQAADALQFGPPLTIYQQVLSPSMKRSTYGLIILYIVLLIFIPFFALIDYLLGTHTQSTEIIIFLLFFLPLGIFTIVLAIIPFHRATLPWYVLLYSVGFISIKGRRLTTAFWDQVTSIRQKSIRKRGFPSMIRFLQDTLSMADGTQLTFNDSFLNLETTHLLNPHDRDWPRFMIGRQESEVDSISVRFGEAREQVTELIHVMEREVTTRLFPKMVTTYQKGLPVVFGQLQMSIEGISDGRKTLPWHELDHIILCGEEDGPLPEKVPYANSCTLEERLTWWQNEVTWNDTLLITGKDGRGTFWSSVLSDVPNAFLLMELADYALCQ